MKRITCLAALAALLPLGCDRDAARRGPSAPAAPNDVATSPAPFVDVTGESGICFVHDVGTQRDYFFPEIMSAGAALLDYDLDGDLDVYLINGAHWSTNGPDPTGPQPTNRLYRQDADGKFVDATAGSGLGDNGYGMGVAVGDINNDGYPDVFVSNYGADRLYLNRQDGTFADITQQAGIDNDRWSASAAFFDFDRDGWLDLFVTNYVDYLPFQPCIDNAGRLDYCNPAVFRRTPDRLYRNLGGDLAESETAGETGDKAPSRVRFADVSLAAGIAEKSGAGLGVVCADLSGDGWPDVYVANDGHANRLWLNQQDGTFRDEAVVVGAAYDRLGKGQAGMGIAIGDLNDDAAFDLLVTHLDGETNALYLSQSAASFQEESLTAGLATSSLPLTGFGAAFVDFEHDGDLDLAVVNGRVVRSATASATAGRQSADFWAAYGEPNQLLVNDGRGRFQLLQSSQDAFSQPAAPSRALACGDIDNDGDVDLLVTNTAGPARLYRNDAVKQGHWLNVRAVDPSRGGRDALGAQVTVHAAGRRWRQLVAPGSSYLASHDPRVHFGLGPATTIERIEVLWPDGAEEAFLSGKETPADQFLVLKRGEGTSP